MTHVAAYVHGIYPRSEELVAATRDLDRGRTTAEAVTAQGVQLRVPDRATLTLKGGATDVASTILALDDAYGTDVAVKLVDGPTHLWTGPARAGPFD